MNSWLIYSHSDLSANLKYPNPSPLGNLVLIKEYKTPSSFRVHFSSDGSDEVYFEVGRFFDLSPQQAVDQFIRDVTSRIEHLEIDPVQEFTFADAPTRRLSIRWPGKQRIILFIDKSDELYRIIYDPNSSINAQILDTFQFRKINR